MYRAVREFLDVLAQQGAFADVRRWTICLVGARVVLRSPSGLPRQPGELKDPTARRLIFVLTDGICDAWRSGGLPRVLAAWARTTPVVIVQMLPERLWPRTAIGVPSAEVWSSVPGVANSAMMIQRQWWDADDAPQAVPIVPITLDAPSIHRWAAALMGAGLTAPAILFTGEGIGAEPTAARPMPAPDATGELSAEERVQRFRNGVARGLRSRRLSFRRAADAPGHRPGAAGAAPPNAAASSSRGVRRRHRRSGDDRQRRLRCRPHRVRFLRRHSRRSAGLAAAQRGGRCACRHVEVRREAP